MPELPTGTVTFLFTDIEGSTRRWEQHTEAMQIALQRHDDLLRGAIAAHAGHVFKTVGDAFCAAFANAADALGAALASQRAVHAEDWSAYGPEFPPIRIRMGIHTGAAQERDGDYFGPPVNRAARLEAAGHGGQVLLSAVTWELVRDDLPAGITLRDLGERRLKDLRRPERVYQVQAPDLPADFPPLTTLDARPNNLPVQLTSFVGREREMAEVKRLLGASHLVTLTGIGGTGKTRLALQAAADLIDDFDHGVWFVDLAPIVDEALVASTVATVLGLREEPGRTIEATLVDSLKAKRLLIVLDNCEQVVAACARLADGILRAAPGVRILATSREALAIPGEATLGIPPLSVPDLAGGVVGGTVMAGAAAALTQYDAVRLFIDRALVVRSDFELTNANAPAVAGICHRLDGIPLAIELAAARVKLLTVEEIHLRLADRFRLLTGGNRIAADRHQTLAAAIDWSHDLLEAPEQALFRRLAVFRDGWTIEAAEAVCGGDEVEVGDVLDLLGRLVDKSLVIADEVGGGTRYRFLETVRQYAGEKLAAAGEVEAVRDRHLVWYLSFAQTAEPHLIAADAPAWIARLEREVDNMRGALDWGLHSDEQARSERGARLALSVVRWLHNCGGPHELARWLDLALAAPATQRQPDFLARCTFACGQGHAMSGDTVLAQSLYEQAIRMFTELGMEIELAWALQDLSGLILATTGDFERARLLLSQSVALKRRVADPWDLAIGINHLGEMARSQGDFKAAIAAYEEAMALTDAGEGDSQSRVWPLHNLGLVLLRDGDVGKARQLLEQALRIGHEYRFRVGVASCLAGLAGVAAAVSDGARAARLFGTADALLEVLGISGLDPLDQSDRDHNEAIGRSLVSRDEWDAAYAEGRAMTEDEAVAYALGGPPSPPAPLSRTTQERG